MKASLHLPYFSFFGMAGGRGVWYNSSGGRRSGADARGAPEVLPPLSSPCGSTAPTPSESGRSAPPPRGLLRGWWPQHPPFWALRPKPRVTFPAPGKSPKARQGSTPGPPRGTLRSPCGSRTPSIGLSATKIDRFATLSLWANRSFFSSSYTGGSHSLFSIRGTAGSLPPRMLEGLSHRNQYR